jgi:hypothetical protein
VSGAAAGLLAVRVDLGRRYPMGSALDVAEESRGSGRTGWLVDVGCSGPGLVPSKYPGIAESGRVRRG